MVGNRNLPHRQLTRISHRFGTFLASIVFDLPLGMAIAVGLSIMIILYGSAKPYCTTLVPVCKFN